MMPRISRRGKLLLAVLLPSLACIAACHSYQIETTVENRTGAAIRLVEFEYPSASFGVNTLAPGEIYRYRIQLRGSGPFKVRYTTTENRQVQLEGQALSEPQEGSLLVVLLPGDKVEFTPHLTPSL